MVNYDEKIIKLKSEQRLEECLTVIEEALVYKSENFGKQSAEFISTAKQLCELCNLIALRQLENKNVNEGLEYLEKAEKIFQGYKDILNICWNNLGCYHTMIGDNNKSLNYFNKALKLSIELHNKKIAAEIYLNISTVLNKISQYKQASEQCLNSIVLIQEFITDPSETPSEEEFINVMNILILAYRNLAVQFDNLNNLSSALLYYEISKSLNDQIKLLPGYENYINKDAVSKNNFIDDRYKLELVKTLKNNSAQLIKTLSKVGKQGRDYYNEFLDEILSNLTSKVESANAKEKVVEDSRNQNNIHKIVEERESMIDNRTGDLHGLNISRIKKMDEDSNEMQGQDKENKAQIQNN